MGEEKNGGHGKDKHQQQTSHPGDKQPGTFAGTNTEHKSLLLGPQGTGREGNYFIGLKLSVLANSLLKFIRNKNLR